MMILCADDYGLNSKVNEAILDLCQRNKIDAVSVLIENLEENHARALSAYNNKIAIGLHLDLFSKSPWQWSASIEKQFNLFTQLFGTFPRYVDGHRHCHIYPMAQNSLLRFLVGCKKPDNFSVRSVDIHPILLSSSPITKRPYLVWLSFLNSGFKKKIQTQKMAHNNLCWGVFNGNMKINHLYNLSQQYGTKSDLFFFHPATENFNEVLERRLDYELFDRD